MRSFKEYYTDHIHNCGLFDYPDYECSKPVIDIFGLSDYYRSSKDFFTVIRAVIATVSTYEVLGADKPEIFERFKAEIRCRRILPNCHFKSYRLLVETLFIRIYLNTDKTIDETLSEAFTIYDEICEELCKYNDK